MNFLFNHIVTLISSMLSAGIFPDTSEIEKRRRQLINGLALLVLLFSAVFLVVTVIAGLNNQALIAFSAVCLMIPIFSLNREGKSNFTSTYLITTSLLLITSAAVSGNINSQFYDIENLLLAIIILNVIVLGGSRRVFFAFVIILITLALKALRFRMTGDSSPGTLVFTEITTLILCLGLHFSMRLFWNVLTDALIKNEEQRDVLFSLIDNVPLHMALLSPEGRFLMVNSNYEKTFERSRDRIIGSRDVDVLPENVLKAHRKYFQKAVKGEDGSFLEESDQDGGSALSSFGKFVPIYDREKNVKAVSVFVSDVSKLKETERALERANKTKERLFSIIAHDLKSPLTSFSSLLNVDKDIVTIEEFHRYRKTIKKRLNTTLFFVDNLLNWSRSQLRSITANMVTVNLSEIIKENVQLYKIQLEQKNIKLFSQFTSKVMVYADKDHLRLVIRNLLHNAIKFTPNRGTIALEARNGVDCTHFTISDTGAGMPQYVLQGLRKNELVNSKPGTNGEIGTGLGLNLCIQLLQKNSAKLEVENIPGLGTSVHIYLPKNQLKLTKVISELTSKGVPVN